jgi:cytoskeletal protein RodZ
MPAATVLSLRPDLGILSVKPLKTFGEKRMSKTKRFLPTWRGALAVLLLLAVSLVLIACGGEPTEVAIEPTSAPTEPAAPTSAPTEPPAPTDAPTEPPAPTDAPTEPPTPTDVPTEPPPTETPAPTEEPTPELVDDTACIACHTDEETLKAVAEEPEEAESLSEGEG